MHAIKLKLENYRNIAAAELEFSRGVNLIYGANGQGKTNTLEAVNIFAQGRAFRTRSDKELVRRTFEPGEPLKGAEEIKTAGGKQLAAAKAAEYAAVLLDFEDRSGKASYAYYASSDGRNSRMANGVRVRSGADFIGRFRAVLFSPEHLELVKGGPNVRRAFFDIAISQLDPLYLGSLSRYLRMVEQRNALLRGWHSASESTKAALDTYTPGMAKEAAYITAARSKYAERADKYVRKVISDMTSGTEKPALNYDGQKSEQDFQQIFDAMRQRDIDRGTTTCGPHRDELTITIGGLPARSFASQGQQRSIALALKLAEGEICRERCGEYPVFLLDDILSELDPGRRAYIMSCLNNRQVIITSCENTMDELKSADSVFRAEGGRIVKVR